ncbi:MAG: serine/threonine protein kinase [Candidatus Xenobia bacterium]
MLQREAVVFDRYQVLGTLGKGPSGTVYLVSVLSQPERRLAMKELMVPQPDPRMFRFFETVGAQLVSLRHRNLASVWDFFVTEQAAYLVLDFVPGRTLWDVLLAQPKAPPWEQSLPWLRQMAEAVGALHAAGIVLRELEPANCMLPPDGVLKVISYGVSRIFTAPEPNPFWAPDPMPDRRADVYSFGATAYAVGSRHLPPEPQERLAGAPLQGAPGLTPEVLAVLEQMMAPRPEDRFADLLEARRALESALAGAPVQKLKWRPGVAANLKTAAAPTPPSPPPPEEELDDVELAQNYALEVLGEYEKFVNNIGNNNHAAPMTLYYRDEVQDALTEVENLGGETQTAWAKVVALDTLLKARAQTLVNEIGWHNFKQYWIMNDPPRERWWWFLSRQVPAPAEPPPFWMFWKKK